MKRISISSDAGSGFRSVHNALGLMLLCHRGLLPGGLTLMEYLIFCSGEGKMFQTDGFMPKIKKARKRGLNINGNKQRSRTVDNIDAGKTTSATTADGNVLAIIKGGLPATHLKVLELNLAECLKKNKGTSKTSVIELSKVHLLRYEEEGVRVFHQPGIGVGELVLWKTIESLFPHGLVGVLIVCSSISCF